MAIVEDLDKKIGEIEKQLKDFAQFKPGSEERQKYLREEIGDAEIYIGKLLIFLRQIRAFIKNREPYK